MKDDKEALEEFLKESKVKSRLEKIITEGMLMRDGPFLGREEELMRV